MANLADLLRIGGEADRAIELLLRARLIALRVQPNGGAESYQFAHNLGLIYHSRSEYGRAEVYYDEALKGRRGTLGVVHPVTQATTGNLGWVYLLKGELGKAEELFRTMVDTARKLDPGPNSGTAYALHSYGLCLLLQKRFAEAEPFRESLAIREDKEAGSWTVFDAKVLVGRALLGQGKYGPAEEYLRPGCLGLQHAEDVQAHGRTPVLDAMDALVEVYTKLGRSDGRTGGGPSGLLPCRPPRRGLPRGRCNDLHG